MALTVGMYRHGIVTFGGVLTQDLSKPNPEPNPAPNRLGHLHRNAMPVHPIVRTNTDMAYLPWTDTHHVAPYIYRGLPFPALRRSIEVRSDANVFQAGALSYLMHLFLTRSEYYKISSIRNMGTMFSSGQVRAGKVCVD